MAQLALANVPSAPVAPAALSVSEVPAFANVPESDVNSGTWFKWEVKYGEDDFGNVLWCEYPKDVSNTLEAMYSNSSTRADSFFLYECQICLCWMPMIKTMCFSLDLLESNRITCTVPDNCGYVS